MVSILSKIREYWESGKPYQGVFEVVGKSSEWEARFHDFRYFGDGDWEPKTPDELILPPTVDPGGQGTYHGIPAITVSFDPNKVTPDVIIKWLAIYGLEVKFITGIRTSWGPLDK